MKNNRLFSTRTLVSAALLAAMSIVLTRLVVIWITPSVRISFGNIPIMLAGIMFGPVVGILVGAVADTVGAMTLSPYGWYAPLTIGPMLAGLIPALLRHQVIKQTNYLSVLGVVFFTNVISSMAYTTWVLSGYSGTPLNTLLAVRVPLYTCISLVEAIVIMLLVKSPLMRAAGVPQISGGKKT
jgi:ECF transporter S component (folate family)